jgi:hypothetical protein
MPLGDRTRTRASGDVWPRRAQGDVGRESPTLPTAPAGPAEQLTIECPLQPNDKNRPSCLAPTALVG